MGVASRRDSARRTKYPMTRAIIAIFFVLLGLPILKSLHAGEPAEPHPLDAHLGERYVDDLDGLLERRYIRVLTTYNRTNFFLAGGKPRGFEYDLLKEYQKDLNKNIPRRELQVVLEFIPVARDRLIPDLVAGYGDIAAAGLTATDLRRQQVDFTDPYLTGIDEVLVMNAAEPPIEAPAGLSGQSLFVRPSSSYYHSLQDFNVQLRAQGKRPVRIVRADENLETEDILELVNSGAVARTICDSHIAAVWKKVFSDIRIYPDVAVRQGGQIAWAVRRDNPQLKASLNRFIQSHRKGTLLGNIYFSRYYEKKTWISHPLRGGTNKRLKTIVPIFKKFAKRYGFDWRLIAAMAYQESGFDQSKVSPRGAVGIMQIRPQTAADPKIGITDVSTVENNIHAAVKYLSLLQRQYFNEADVRPRDQVRFSLAAYNAGPARIRRARRLAGQMHLDPNRWFRNVEMAMLKIVGQETVRYVSNINKYYVIYRNAFERVEEQEAAVEQVRQ
ncbi:transglycosylase SLT domain-containing protein [uncultured Desulfosarcina sp.]|uniref:transglycosylase SLT domain-containing protein n=1 Tax=uncultured Desulfosarcina sp. TaxID=218289 RepID=UPI0029C7ECE3|nr:transporter substrate-binding domain-containing protein [uncultured Desulfosarcina sp.]